MKAVTGALQVRHANTLHGFNAFTDDGSLILGVLSWSRYAYPHGLPEGEPAAPELSELELNAVVRAALKLSAAEYVDFSFKSFGCGRDVLMLPMALRDRAGVAIDAARRAGFHVALQTKLLAFYRAQTWETQPFSKEESERLVLAGYEEAEQIWEQIPPKHAVPVDVIYKPHADMIGDRRLWCTAAGQAFAERIAHLFPTAVDLKTPIYLTDEPLTSSPFDYPPLQRSKSSKKENTPSAAAATKKEESSNKEESSKKEESVAPGSTAVAVAAAGPANDGLVGAPGYRRECVVCLSDAADTTVLPCQHSVVCSACSEKLKTTPDAKICIQCRKPLTSILHSK